MSIRGLTALLGGLLIASIAAAGPARADEPLMVEVPIEHPERLTRTFARLRSLEQGGAGRVRVTHFGDSHIAADLWTGPLRARLQARFGDGGRGHVLVGRPWSSHWQQHLRNTSAGAWRVDGLRGGLADGFYGAGGCSMASADGAATARVEVPARAAAGRGGRVADVHYLRQPSGGCVELRVGDAPIQRLDTRGPWPSVAFARVELPSGQSSVSVHPIAGAESRLLGISLEGGRGVIYDALGINGARITRLLRQDPLGFTAVVRRLDPTLVVLSYGTNDLFDDDLDLQRFARDLDQALALLQRATPNADCLVTGPPDFLRRGQPVPAFSALLDAQRAIAEARGCAFFDLQAAMGGPGSIQRWRRQRHAQRDRVHLTRDGYARLAQLTGDALLAAYEASALGPDRARLPR